MNRWRPLAVFTLIILNAAHAQISRWIMLPDQPAGNLIYVEQGAGTRPGRVVRVDSVVATLGGEALLAGLYPTAFFESDGTRKLSMLCLQWTYGGILNDSYVLYQRQWEGELTKSSPYYSATLEVAENYAAVAPAQRGRELSGLLEHVCDLGPRATAAHSAVTMDTLYVPLSSPAAFHARLGGTIKLQPYGIPMGVTVTFIPFVPPF